MSVEFSFLGEITDLLLQLRDGLRCLPFLLLSTLPESCRGARIALALVIGHFGGGLYVHGYLDGSMSHVERQRLLLASLRQ